MAAHVSLVKGLFLGYKVIQAFRYGRAGFKYSKPVTLKQKLVYFATFSFL